MEPGRSSLEGLIGGDPIPSLTSPDPDLRRLAVAACGRLGAAAVTPLEELAASDPNEHVRAEAVETLGALGRYEAVLAATGDPSMRVVEAAATALGEIADPRAVPRLLELATGDHDPLVQEAAIAGLGAIGDDRALPVLLEIVRSGRPRLRRRAVVALTAFEGPGVEAAFAAARLDRNPMVREVAEMVIGRSTTND